MCRRYRIEKETLYRFQDIPGFHKAFQEDVTEGQIAPALVLENGRFAIHALSFGFDIVEKRVLNARIETVDQKDFFLSSFRERRCVLFCSSFFETDDAGIEREFLGKGTLYLAGIYKNGEFVIITTKPEEDIAFYHKRIPLVLERERVRDYLSLSPDKETILSYRKPPLKVRGGSDQLTLF